jgi:hypothetical protein
MQYRTIDKEPEVTEVNVWKTSGGSYSQSVRTKKNPVFFWLKTAVNQSFTKRQLNFKNAELIYVIFYNIYLPHSKNVFKTRRIIFQSSKVQIDSWRFLLLGQFFEVLNNTLCV